jgi:CBS domain-containing protein
MPLLVKDVMSTPVITVEEDKTVKEAAEVMSKAKVGCVIVVKKGKPVGIVTNADMVKRIVAKDLKSSEIKVKDIMSSPLITVKPDDDIMVAVRKIKRNKIHRVTVVEGDKVVGILSTADIAATSPELLDLLEYRLKLREFEPRIVEEFAAGICELCGNYSERLKNINGQWVCEECEDLIAAEEI